MGVIELERDLGVVAKRIFCISADRGAIRAAHAVSSVQFLVSLVGSVTVDLDNGRERKTAVLSTLGEGLLIQRGVWRRLSGFSGPTLLLVAAADSYAETATRPTPFFFA